MGAMDQPSPIPPLANAYWRIASSATHLAKTVDPAFFHHDPDAINPCDPDPLVDSAIADLAERIVRREATDG